MNPSTGELVSDLRFLDEGQRKEFVPIPDDLHRAASMKLAGADRAMVSLTSGGRLSRFAAEQRRAAAPPPPAESPHGRAAARRRRQMARQS